MTRCLFVPVSSLLALVVWSCGWTSTSDAQSVRMAIAQAQQTGRPIFAVAGATSCPHCVVLIQRLNTEERLQPLVAQFVPLKLDVTSNEFARWERFFPRQRAAIPALYVVSPQGEELYHRTGGLPTDGLEEMMLDILRKAGRYPTDEQWAELAKKFTASKELLEKEQPMESLATVEPHLEAMLNLGPLLEYHKSSPEIVKQLERLEAMGGPLLTTMASAGDGANFELALDFARVERMLSAFPSLEQEINSAGRTFAAGSDQRRLLRDARELDQAIAMLADQTAARRAQRTIDRILKKYPDSPAAEFVESEKAKLAGE